MLTNASGKGKPGLAELYGLTFATSREGHASRYFLYWEDAAEVAKPEVAGP